MEDARHASPLPYALGVVGALAPLVVLWARRAQRVTRQDIGLTLTAALALLCMASLPEVRAFNEPAARAWRTSSACAGPPALRAERCS